MVREYGKVHKMQISIAMKELDELGLLTKKRVSEAKEEHRVEKKKTREQNLREKRKLLKKKQQKRKYEDKYIDETYAFIAGYTSNGFPYGVTHEEIEQRNREKSWLDFEDFLNHDHFDEFFNDICVVLEFWFSEDYAEEMSIEGVQSTDYSVAPPENLLMGTNWQSLLKEIEQTK